MITEDYVSFEVAKLLFEKHFKQNLSTVYNCYGDLTHISEINDDELFWYAPTLQMAMKWLRENHNIFIATQFGWFHGDYLYEASVVKMNPTIPPTPDSIEYVKIFREVKIEDAILKAINFALRQI